MSGVEDAREEGSSGELSLGSFSEVPLSFSGSSSFRIK
jgi:hypothetical protein